MKFASTSLLSPAEFPIQEASTSRHLILGGAGIILVFAPLAYAAVHPWAYFAVGLIVAVLSLVIMANWLYLLWIRPHGEVVVPYPPMWWLALGLGLVVLLQVIPWPQRVVGWLSPSAIAIRALGNGYALADFIPISLNPYATILESLKEWPAVVLFFVLIFTVKTQKQINALIYLILAIALFEVIFGFWTFHEHVIWGWKSPYNPQRLCGTFINPDHLATYLTMAILLGFGLFLGQKERVAPSPEGVTGRRLLKRWSWSEHAEPQFRRFLLLFLLVVLTTGLIFTGSRGGMISLVMGFGLMALFIWSQKWRKAYLYLIAIFVVLALIYSLILGGNIALARFLNLDISRYYISLSAWDQFREFPWIGSGVGSFADLAYRYQAPELKGIRLVYAHSDWVQSLAETGLLGFSLVAGACLFFFFKLLRQWRSRQDVWARGLGLGGLAALGMAGLHGLVEFSFHIPAVTLLFSSIAAVTYLSLYSHRRMWESLSYRTINLSQKRLGATGIIVFLILVQLFFVWQVGVHWLAELTAPTEQNSTTAAPQLKLKDYRDALAYNQRNSRYYIGLAEALAAGDAAVNLAGRTKDEPLPSEVEKLLQTAIFYNPGHWAYRLKLAEIYLKLYKDDPSRYLPQALEEFDAAVKLFPNSGYLHLRLGTTLSWAENHCLGLVPLKFRGQSAEYLKRAIELDHNLKKMALPYLPPERSGLVM
ncbi:MAG: O-antigen ligase family protein [Desulfobaccales bacterium]